MEGSVEQGLGGLVEEKGVSVTDNRDMVLPFPIESGQDLLDYTEAQNVSISEIVHQNELQFRSEKEIVDGIKDIYNTMLECVYKGCTTDGVLPGGLNVKRRAKALCNSLLNGQSFNSEDEWMEVIKKQPQDFNTVNKWITDFFTCVFYMHVKG